MKTTVYLWFSVIVLFCAGIQIMFTTGTLQAQSVEAVTIGTEAPKSPFRMPLKWESTSILVSPVSDEKHTIVSVKDPTIVRYNNLWHIYATVYSTSSRTWSMVYLNFKDWSDAPKTKLTHIDVNPNLTGYHCAPQLFYFRPHKKWYLIFQSQQPQYCTTDDLSKPETWTKPQDFFETKPAGAPHLWIDYWVICDDTHAYLYFTGDNGRLYRSRTKIENFPRGMSNPEICIEGERFDVFEGNMTYKVKNTNTYLTLVEAIGPARYYRAWIADSLNGEWKPIPDAATWDKPFAGISNVTFSEGVTPWTEDISHGELIRDGYDETMTIDPDNLKLLFQGRDPKSGGEYNLLPYRLGLLTIKKSETESFNNTGLTQPQKGKIEIVHRLAMPENSRQLQEKDFGGYLMVYFKDQTQSAYMAVSRDGYTFTDLNNGQPIFEGSQLAEQKGVRDPHITRGPDGGFYLVMTDLHIFGQKAGYRDTQWQRPEEKYGWGNNRAIVMMKSFDLIHWTVSDFRVDTAFPELGDIDCAWAPETIYDAAAKKMMVYFTIRYGNKNANIYYSYANEAFTKLETTPKMIPDIGGIDGDITKVGEKFHLYYVSDARILHAVSNQINKGYRSEPQRIDPETVPTEAPNLFKRLGSETYVLMYDVYGGRPNNMGFSETTDFVTYKHIGRFNEGAMKGTNFSRPKHGAVTYLTLDELKKITQHWHVDIKLDKP
ncbi:MAG: hypothetical protein JXA06_08980 [Bacteroidetes bacterium]|nr:hypothetical protein [Bacteroidota bacterium]